MKAIELPLVLASDHAAPERAAYPLDRIRMQKAVFLLTQRGSADWRELYHYEPYNWGPYSSALNSDVGTLVQHELLKNRVSPVSRYGSFETTVAGDAAAGVVWERLSEPQRSFIKSVRDYVADRSFSSLLREVYAAYPEFATKSQFSG